MKNIILLWEILTKSLSCIIESLGQVWLDTVWLEISDGACYTWRVPKLSLQFERILTMNIPMKLFKNLVLCHELHIVLTWSESLRTRDIIFKILPSSVLSDIFRAKCTEDASSQHYTTWWLLKLVRTPHRLTAWYYVCKWFGKKALLLKLWKRLQEIMVYRYIKNIWAQKCQWTYSLR